MKKLTILGIVILFSTLAYALSGTVTTFTNNLSSENLTFNGSQDIARYIDVPLYAYVTNLSLRLEGLNTTISCYQETANISNDCGGLGTGNYSFGGAAGNWNEHPNNAYDGDPNTSTSTIGGLSLPILFNYTKPEGALNSSVWQVKDNNATVNLTLPQSCFDNAVIQLAATSQGTQQKVDWQCYNSSGQYHQLRYLSTTNDIFEESMTWISKYPENLSLEIGNQDGNYEWNYSGKYNISEDVSMNISVINNVLQDNCNCTNCTIQGTICRMPIISHAGIAGTLSMILLNASYEYGLDDCSSYTYNTFNLSYYDEVSLDPITLTNAYNLNLFSPFSQNLSGTFSGSTNDNFCSRVNISAVNLSYSVYGTFNLQKSGYTTRIYSNDISNPYILETDPPYGLDLYLISSTNTSEVTFTTKNILTSSLIEDAQVKMYRLINGSLSLVEQRLTDITGKAQFSYIENEQYNFEFSKTGYTNYSFELNPIQSANYDVYLTPIVSINNTQNYDRISIAYSPYVFYDGRQTNFNFTIYSPYSELNSYGYNITFPGGNVSNSGTSAPGETLTSQFTISGADAFDRIKIDYYYNIDITGTRTFTFYHDIIIAPGNNTMINNRDKTYGMGIFERLFISVLIVLLTVGIAALIGQILPGMALGLLLFGYLVAIGFIPIWSILISMMAGLILLSARSS